MKILLTADYHIKLSQKNIPKDWAINRFRSLFRQIREIKADIHVVAGDIFDRLPSFEELQLFYEFVISSNKPTYIIDGNHCATKKGHTFLSLLENIPNIVNPNVHIVTEVTEYPWGTLLPYCKLHSMHSKGLFDSLNPSKPLFTHVRGEIPPHVVPEIDLSVFDKFPVVFAGDLHSHSNSQRNIIYPGSPITTSFHRNLVDTGYILINDDLSWVWETFDVPQLIRKTVNSEEEMIPTKYHHTIYEIEGNLSELSGIKNVELLDKKIIKRSSEAALILTKQMTMEEELAEFLTYVLELPDDLVKNTVGVFRDSISKNGVG